MWRCLPLWLHHVPENKLQAFRGMPSGCVPLRTKLRGLHEALSLPSLPPSLYKVLHQTLSTFFLQLPKDPVVTIFKEWMSENFALANGCQIIFAAHVRSCKFRLFIR